MQLSLKMLAKRMEAFDVELFDTHNMRGIESFCLFRPGQTPPADTVCVGIWENFFPAPSPKAAWVVLMYETDYLLFHTEDFTAVLNALIETFSLYAKWEHALNQLLYQSSSLQDILSVSDAVIDAPLLVLDQSDRLIAVTPKYETVSVSAEWFDLLERKGASTERILQFHDQSLGYYDVNNKEPFYLDSLFPTPCYSLNLWEGDTFFGLLVLVEHDKPLCGGTVDEFQMLGQYVCQWMKQNSSSDLFSMEQSLLAEAINEHPDGIANLERYLHP